MNRRWCAVIQYPNKKPILFGTLHCDPKCTMAELEKRMRELILTALPDGFRFVNFIPGALWFDAEKNA